MLYDLIEILRAYMNADIGKNSFFAVIERYQYEHEHFKGFSLQSINMATINTLSRVI